MTAPVYSIVVPLYNEKEIVEELFRRLHALLARLDGPGEVILVNDGSRDDSDSLLVDLHRRDERFKVVNLSRNFGHQIAITAGMDMACGKAIVIMDADLQDPPEVVLEMAARWREGFDLVYAVRQERAGESWFKRLSAWGFYRFLNRLTSVKVPADVGDFRLVDRKVLRAFNELREGNRCVRGMFAWVGFKQTAVYYSRAARFAGKTKYSLRKMFKFAMDGVVSFSITPLQIAASLGLASLALGLAGAAWAALTALRGGTVPLWDVVVASVAWFTGVQLLVLGLLGEYVGRIYQEVLGRPLYIVRELHGIAMRSEPSRVVLPESLAVDEDRLAGGVPAGRRSLLSIAGTVSDDEEPVVRTS